MTQKPASVRDAALAAILAAIVAASGASQAEHPQDAPNARTP
jgi:hypothetical protein